MIRGLRLTPQAVWNVVHDCASQARLFTKKISPHTLRHSFATALLPNGENLQTIRILMNHKNLWREGQAPARADPPPAENSAGSTAGVLDCR